MSGRFLSPKDISAAKLEEEVFNSMLKRGEIKDPDRILRTQHIVCGYGMIGSYETKEISPERLAKFFVEEGIVSVDGFDTEDKVETNK